MHSKYAAVMEEPGTGKVDLSWIADTKEASPLHKGSCQIEDGDAGGHSLEVFEKMKYEGSFASEPGEPAPLSKNQQKKLKRKQEWKEGREARKVRRKEKNKAKREKDNAAVATDGVRESIQVASQDRQQTRRAVQLPITFIVDCQFDDMMTDNERTSLSSQLTRCYSANKRAPFRAHLAISSFGGKLKDDRFDSTLNRNHESWRGVTFHSEDFMQVAGRAGEVMRDSKFGDTIAGTWASIKSTAAGQLSAASTEEARTPLTQGEVIYLTSESCNTLQSLKPYSTYIIGGLVDKNRHKGVCYKRALDRGIKTAKLPINDHMKMHTRYVLTTNQVNEIMLKWLECGDWGEAFVQVMPKRKGGVLKNSAGTPVSCDQSTDEDKQCEHA